MTIWRLGPIGIVLGATMALVGQGAAQETPLDLGRLFTNGHLVLDENGDGVPDRINASLVLGSSPSNAVVRAAAEISARLGFETMAMNLPLARGAAAPGVPIVIGTGGLAAAGLPAEAGTLAPGEGLIAVRRGHGRDWLVIAGADDAGVLAAARRFAGALPHTRTLSSPHLDSIRMDLLRVLERSGIVGAQAVMQSARVRDGAPALAVITARITVDSNAAAGAGDALHEALARRDDPVDSTTADSVRLRYADLDAIAVHVTSRDGSLLRTLALPVGTGPAPPGPIAGRPGRGNKESLDLSNLYRRDGLLADGDGNLIPDRVDAVLVAGQTGIDLLPDLAGRLGLESTGLTVPLTRDAADIAHPDREPVMVLVGTDNSVTQRLVDSGVVSVTDLDSGDGIIQVVRDAFGGKPVVVVTGADDAGAHRALRHLTATFPHLDARGRDRPTLDDVERGLWSFLSGRSPGGQAASALYKLDRIVARLRDTELDSVQVLISIEKPDSGFEDAVRRRAAAFGASQVQVVIDDRDVQRAGTLIDERVVVPSEVDRFWSAFRARVVPAARRGGAIEVEARLSEPPEVRAAIAERATRELVDGGADPNETRVTVLSAYKQGYSWLYESVRPRVLGHAVRDIVVRFRRNEPPAEWPQQAMHTPVRWLHEIFPIDEILARELDVDLDRVRFEMTTDGPTYEVVVTSTAGDTLVNDSFDPRWVLRPYFDRFRDYEQVRVTTGWLRAVWEGREVVVDERIVTDPEWFWDYYQSRTLPAMYDYVMDRHEGNPRGGGTDAPFFGELTVDLELSEPHYLLDLDKEIIAPMDALHEEIYFGTIEFFHLIGRNARGQDLTYPGRIIPVMRPKADGTAGHARIRLTGFATQRPAVVVTYRTRAGEAGEVRLDIPRITMERPSARRARIRADVPGLTELTVRVRVDTDADERERLLHLASQEQVDRSMISAAQVAAVIQNLDSLRAAGMYRSTLAYSGLRDLVVHAEWTHEDDEDSRRTVALPGNGQAEPLPDWRPLVPDGWRYRGERMVQWERPIPPPEGHRILAQMASAFDQVRLYRAGTSYLGKPIWAADLTSPVTATHVSRAKETTFKPTVVYSARQHANEVSSTSHVLRHAELLLTDPDQRAKLDRVNVVIHPFTNPDGAQLAYDLFEITPELILHAGYLGSLGMDATAGGREDFPIYPEASVRQEIWNDWLPDVFLNPHGYPSHQVVQIFSEYTGLVRRGRVTERNWGFNKGWFMPGFRYVDDPEYPRHKDAALSILDYITRGINRNRDVFEMNQRNYARYARYGADFDPDVFRLPMTDSVLIHLPLKGSRGGGSGGGGGGYNPRVTIWSGTTEAPDETAHGPWMELVAKAGLSWDQAVLDYLHDGSHTVERSGSTFFGGVTLKMNRPRPPKTPNEP